MRTAISLAVVLAVSAAAPSAQEPEAPSPAAVASMTLQAVVDALTAHETGAATVAEAEAGVTAAEAELERVRTVAETVLTAARQRVADVQSDRDTSSATIVERATAVVEFMQALIAEHSPGAP